MKYYEILLQQCARHAGNNQEWETFNHETKKFGELKEVRVWLKENYGNNKTKTKMYSDDKNGKPQHCGYIYSSKGTDRGENGKPYHFFQQDWVEIRECKAKTIIV